MRNDKLRSMKTFITILFAGCIALSWGMVTDTAANVTTSGEKPSTALTMNASTQKKDNSTMNNSKKCKDTNLHRAQCMIELILEDISANYTATGGGGISSIKAASSTSYIVSLPQEERIDIFTYEFKIENGVVSLKSKVASTQSFDPAPQVNDGITKSK